MSARVFLLSPARCDGERAKLVFNPRAEFALARALREERGGGVELGEAFSFLSGLYFRGKLAYARTFARPPRGVPGALIITTDRGLVSAETRVRLEDLRAFACVDIGRADERFRAPLRKDVVRLAKRLRPGDDVVLLGSIATGKYVDTLVDVFGERLLFPQDFVGRGDMSRGGLLLRRVREQRELEYVPIAGATRHGKRPPKLEPVRWSERELSQRAGTE